MIGKSFIRTSHPKKVSTYNIFNIIIIVFISVVRTVLNVDVKTIRDQLLMLLLLFTFTHPSFLWYIFIKYACMRNYPVHSLPLGHHTVKESSYEEPPVNNKDRADRK